jgi:hypothetical protein
MGQGSALIYQDCCYSWDKREVIVVIARTQRRLSNLHLRERMKECHKRAFSIDASGPVGGVAAAAAALGRQYHVSPRVHVWPRTSCKERRRTEAMKGRVPLLLHQLIIFQRGNERE